MALTAKLSFQSTTSFHGDLKKRVDAYFIENGISKYANRLMYGKIAFWFVFAWGAWAVACFVPMPLPLMLTMFAVQGFGFACIGFNIGHDAIHGGFSDKRWVNKLLSWSFDIMGAASPTWSVSHNVVHHTYTNIQQVDGDLEPGPWLVFYPQPTKFFHRFQHLYAWPLYTFVGVIWVYLKDFVQLRAKDPISGKGLSKAQVAQVFAGKILHVGLLLGVPLLVIEAPVWQILLGYLCFLASAGFTLAIVFQLAHCVEGVVFPKVPETNENAVKMPVGWAEHQLRTTANFGKTWLATWICGGLDHQIEHHLFPRICHIHYRALAPIVRQCADDYGVPYMHNGSFLQAVGVHARTLKKLGAGQGAELKSFAYEPVPDLAPAAAE